MESPAASLVEETLVQKLAVDSACHAALNVHPQPSTEQEDSV